MVLIVDVVGRVDHLVNLEIQSSSGDVCGRIQIDDVGDSEGEALVGLSECANGLEVLLKVALEKVFREFDGDVIGGCDGGKT